VLGGTKVGLNIFTREGKDRVFIDDAVVNLVTGEGDDWIRLTKSWGTVSSGTGKDKIEVIAANPFVAKGHFDEPSTLISLVVNAGEGDDILDIFGNTLTTNTDGLVSVMGNVGEDRFNLKGGRMQVFGNEGSDNFIGNADASFLYGDDKTATTAAGNDIFKITGNQNLLDGGNGNDQLTITGNNNTLLPGQGNDRIAVTGDNNLVDLTGGGNDTLNIQGTGNRVRFDGTSAGVSSLRTLEATPSVMTKSTVLDVGSVEGLALFRRGEHLVLGNTTAQLTVSSQFNRRSLRGVGQIVGQNTAGETVTLSTAQLDTITQQMATYARSNGITLNTLSDVQGNTALMSLVAGAWT
jgi:Ca2+-binding RTX toxin-like protein